VDFSLENLGLLEEATLGLEVHHLAHVVLLGDKSLDIVLLLFEPLQLIQKVSEDHNQLWLVEVHPAEGLLGWQPWLWVTFEDAQNRI
jgi:hypothetical protein